MNLSSACRRAVAVSSAIFLLAGCAGGGSAPPSPQQATGVQARAIPAAGKSISTSGDLLYVSDPGAKAVYFYSYPGLEKIGQLTGIGIPYGLCTDSAGNVFVTNTRASGDPNILEYAHGGTTPIQTLSDPGQEPFGCAVSPVTGDLAVTNTCAFKNGGCGTNRRTKGDLRIYPHATGIPRAYRFSSIRSFYFCGYDAKGNLYADGSGHHLDRSYFFVLVELPRGSTSFRQELGGFSTSNDIEYPGGVQWDGTHLAFGSATGEHIKPSVYRVNTSTWKLASKITLRKSQDVPSFLIDGRTLIVPNIGKQGQILFYSYPKGVKAGRAIDGLKNPVSVVVSPGTDD